MLELEVWNANTESYLRCQCRAEAYRGCAEKGAGSMEEL